MSTDDDQLVEDYLRELHIAAQGLPADRRDELIEEITAHITEARQSDGSPLAVRNILDAVHNGVDMPFGEGCEYEATLFGLTAATDDMREGTRAFLEKRKPAFKGQ